MIDMNVAAPLAQALEAKGYEALTAVQQAVLAEGVEGRDLLVSAQTGSGKTVAFGLAIAPEILAGSDRLLYADKPIALVVAPTRELALQVKRELEWLYGVAGAQIASCVGGMDYRTEKRALDRGAHIVVGTPGRLRDHIERGSLDLSFCRATVLDEADEMLDLGFAEDLEFILGAAPEDRRTLMFSATVPKEIETLARTFQRDAMRIVAKGETKQHADIKYRAMSVAARDREHAIFNVLRYYDAPTAIVFCKTRMNVNHLMARMTNRGFQVVALSGELSQQERTHALQSLRDGRARVCIATDVAARGIDLPGLELVIHADLPSNSETLLHRSGRTGRAGNKGVSALIVVPAEAKKAQRLLAGAKVVADWVKAPSAEEVQAKDDQRILEHPALAEAIGDEQEMVTTLIEKFGAEQTAAAFIRLWREGRSAPEVLSDSLPPPPAAAPRERGEFGPSVWFSLSVGHSGRAEARWILPKICDGAGISKDGIGAIRVKEDVTFVQIAEPLAGRFGGQLELEPGLTMSRMEGEPSLDRPERAPRPQREDRPAYKPKAPRVVEDEAIVSAPAPARKPYVKRDDAERKPYTPREEKPYAPRPAAAERKPYAPRDAAAERKPYAKREDGDRKPYAPREGGERKPYAKREDAPAGGAKFKSAGYKSFGGSADKPARAAGFKSHAAEGTGYKPKAEGDRAEKRTYAPKGDEARPYAKREGKPAGKPAGFKSAGFKSAGADSKKPFTRKSDGPARPRADAKDTSKRFVPPKGAKR
ncbi:DEAD/DEAH box helicase [Pseudotabrizicola algicola]|uniref:DEAD/DEAH box helicase n=1 Tax=Pseudotabrizicola algicola TaxID=2709381 RepID=A0A6B3RTM3_9RHOB|nr:DEAD/DEAH box helicase [Pseudotabrizicola algicola]NEX46422.1 DEAD/DEAH box helicase [Pseudotabrizicola algicola]